MPLFATPLRHTPNDCMSYFVSPAMMGMGTEAGTGGVAGDGHCGDEHAWGMGVHG